jgi:general bacterial porin, GBP family
MRTCKVMVLASISLCSHFSYAQSSVTLYGILDLGVMYVSNAGGHHDVAMVAGTTQNDRWGLRVVEDLGGGLSTVATLENGFDPTSGKLGQGGREFGRQAWVGLSDKQWGTFTAGRQYDAMWDVISPFSAEFNENSLASNVGDNDNLFGSFRYSNSVKYVSPTIAGIQGEALYAFSNQAGEFSVNRAVTAGLSYANGPLSLGFAYTGISQPGLTNPSGAVTNDYGGASFQLFHVSPLNSDVGVDSQREFGIGGAYQVNKFRLSGLVTNVKYTYLDHTSLRLTNFELGASYYILPSLVLAGGYTYTTGRYGDGFSGSPKWNMIHASLGYYLSKRTDVSLWIIGQQSSGGPADVYLATPSTTDRQAVVSINIRHKF